jgi:maltose O-acetyltransferase
MKSEKEKMLAGELYTALDPELGALNLRAQLLLHDFNSSTPNEIEKRRTIVPQLFGQIGSNFEVKQPFYCDYGSNIFAGDNLFINYDCVIIDCNVVRLGNNVLLAPKVQIYTAHHPITGDERRTGLELASPVSIGEDVWIGGGAIICPGVTIGAGTTIGAGSVVTKDIPPNVVAVGNPCRVIRFLK